MDVHLNSKTARRVLDRHGMNGRNRMHADTREPRDEPAPRQDRPSGDGQRDDPPTKPNDPTGKELTTPDETLGG
jgi:hypothetical protein